jgi:putative NADH-flavin reductase
MNILVIGASRGIGKAVTAEALSRGHAVRAFARSAAEIAPAERLEPWPGDATSAADLEPALQGQDAVVMALGIKESLSMLWKEVTLFSEATRALVPLMQARGPRRLVVITGIGAGESAAALSGPERLGHRMIFSQPYRDKTRQEEIVRDSGLDWTLVRPTILTGNRASRRYRVMVEPKDWRMGVISRADVADYVLRALEDESTIHTAPVLAR